MKKSKIFVLAVMALVVAAAGVGIWAYSVATSKFGGNEPVRIYLPRGCTDESVTDSLEHRLGKYGTNVARMWRWLGGKPAAAEGSYVISPGEKAFSACQALRHGQQTPVRVTYNNVRTMDQLAERVACNLEITPEDFMAACDSVLPAAGYAKAEYPAAFLPDTYEFYWNASPQKVVSTLLAFRNRYWTDERMARASSLGLTPNQAATLASIVEEETAKADEKPAIARLYLNRLKIGMLLQADPTVKFGVGDFGLRRILREHLLTESPYNTYKHAGLPPGPIRVASQQGIDAVLNAPSHDYLYMCAKEDFSGYHNFAKNFAEHQANAQRYHRALNKRGIK